MDNSDEDGDDDGDGNGDGEGDNDQDDNVDMTSESSNEEHVPYRVHDAKPGKAQGKRSKQPLFLFEWDRRLAG